MRFILKAGLVMLPLIFISLLCATPGADAKKGKAVYTKSCLMCHTENGEAKPAIEKMFAVKMRPLASKEVQSISDAELTKLILEGKGKMKPVKLSAADAADVVAFMRTLKK